MSDELKTFLYECYLCGWIASCGKEHTPRGDRQIDTLAFTMGMANVSKDGVPFSYAEFTARYEKMGPPATTAAVKQNRPSTRAH